VTSRNSDRERVEAPVVGCRQPRGAADFEVAPAISPENFANAVMQRGSIMPHGFGRLAL
jgi:hypothetical protein